MSSRDIPGTFPSLASSPGGTGLRWLWLSESFCELVRYAAFHSSRVFHWLGCQGKLKTETQERQGSWSSRQPVREARFSHQSGVPGKLLLLVPCPDHLFAPWPHVLGRRSSADPSWSTEQGRSCLQWLASGDRTYAAHPALKNKEYRYWGCYFGQKKVSLEEMKPLF